MWHKSDEICLCVCVCVTSVILLKTHVGWQIQSCFSLDQSPIIKNMLRSSLFFVYSIKIVVIRFFLYCGQGAISQPQKIPFQTDPQQGNSFTLQLFQRTLEETLATFQKSVHEDMRNLHIEILRQFHMQEVTHPLLFQLHFLLLFFSWPYGVRRCADGNVNNSELNPCKPSWAYERSSVS